MRCSAFARNADTIVLGLPRGGVPVAHEIARELELPLDVLVVRKVGAPGQPELAMGAVASGGAASSTTTCWRTSRMPKRCSQRWPSRNSSRSSAARRCSAPVEVRSVCRIASVSSSTTGSQPVRRWRPPCARCGRWAQRRIVVAVPVASRDAVSRLERSADEVVCLLAAPLVPRCRAVVRGFRADERRGGCALLAERASGVVLTGSVSVGATNSSCAKSSRARTGHPRLT